MLGKQYIENEAIMNLKRMLILLLACLAAQTALAEPSLAEKNAAENAAIKKEWESWNAPFQLFRLIGTSITSVRPVSARFSSPRQGHLLIDTGFETIVLRIRE